MRDLVLPDEPDRIVVSKDRLARCTWCGTLESNGWVFSEKGKIYCTTECMLADNVGRTRISAIATLACSIVILLPYLIFFALGSPGIGMEPTWEFIIFGIMFFILGIGGVLTMNEGKKYQDRKGKYNGTPPLECEYCNHPNPPSATRCLNCDAALSRAPFVSESIPPWIYKQKRVKGVKCPHCHAIYSYLPSMISDDRQVVCQNCNRQFSLPFLDDDSSVAMKRAQY